MLDRDLVEQAWTCECGSLNAGSRTTCGGCNNLKPIAL